MLKIFFVVASVLSVTGFTLAAPVPAPINDLVGRSADEFPSGDSNGPNGTSLQAEGLLGAEELPTGDSNGPNGTSEIPGGFSSHSPSSGEAEPGLLTGILDAVL
ncbi:hypothetical protein SCHPADRAFT_908689 [Schizopora paradoxa]|uniref:Secreted protein n=1 Tax=Schizopora paradoxa TaxID=27342 RepID=A0A0H2RU18_9AGAM|nr:hypothetical protein SCHPADRAFT_908689 [Schizopora paradoxa]